MSEGDISIIDSPNFRKGFVYVQRKYAGILLESDNGYSFVYDQDYLKDGGLPVSLTLPCQEATYESKTLFAFFDGLIPEGWLLNVVSRNWKIDKRDRFALLLAACKDSVGDVYILSEGDGE